MFVLNISVLLSYCQHAVNQHYFDLVDDKTYHAFIIINKNRRVYKITNDFNTDIWIGSSCDTLLQKFSAHKADAGRNLRKDCIIHNLIREYGFDRFRIQLIC